MRERKRRNRDKSALQRVGQAPKRQAVRNFGTLDPVSADDVEAIHRASLKVMRDTGILFMSDRARHFLETHPGITVDHESQIVRFDPDMVEETIKSVPRTFKIHARDDENSMMVGGTYVNFANVITPPYVTDLDQGKRIGTHAEMRDLLRLGQTINALDYLYGYPVEPQDLPAETRHLDAYRSHIELTSKIWRGYTLGDSRIRDAIEMARIARGISAETLLSEPSFIANATTNSPLRIDEPMGDGLMIMAEHNQPVSITSFAMAGAIAPITISGATVLQNAEILAGVVLTQLVRPGTPIIYGTFTANVYMRTGAIAFGGPDLAKATLLGGQMARRYGFPLKSAVTTGAKVSDAQAGYESNGALWTAVASGATLVAHACGWMESGLTVSREKMIIDAEMIQMMAATMEPIETDSDALAVAAIDEVGPGGQYFDCDHTMQRFRTENYEPILSDWESLENWQAAGAQTAEQKANGVWKKLMKEYEQPALDPAIKEELDAYVTVRRAAIEADLTAAA